MLGLTTLVQAYQLPQFAATTRVSARAAVSAQVAAPLADVFAMDSTSTVRIQGTTLKTWDVSSPTTGRVQVSLKSEGRPIESRIELWTTPDYIPAKMRVYTMDGKKRPVNAVIETPKETNTVAVYNNADIEFPFDAAVVDTGLGKAMEVFADKTPKMVQGGGVIRSYTFGPEVDSVQVLLKTAGLGERNMKAMIEVTEGPNQVKQIVELYTSSGYKNPFYITLALPQTFSTVRIINENSVEFPFDAYVEPYETNDSPAQDAVVVGGTF